MGNHEKDIDPAYYKILGKVCDLKIENMLSEY
jgi:hypothetical protein